MGQNFEIEFKFSQTDFITKNDLFQVIVRMNTIIAGLRGSLVPENFLLLQALPRDCEVEERRLWQQKFSLLNCDSGRQSDQRRRR